MIARRRRAAEAERIKGGKTCSRHTISAAPKKTVTVPIASSCPAICPLSQSSPPSSSFPSACSASPRAAPPFSTLPKPPGAGQPQPHHSRPTTRSPHLTFRVSTTDHSALHASSVVSISGRPLLTTPPSFGYLPQRQPRPPTRPPQRRPKQPATSTATPVLTVPLAPRRTDEPHFAPARLRSAPATRPHPVIRTSHIKHHGRRNH